MNSFFRCLALSPLLALVAACCSNTACNRDDLRADSIYLTFDRTSPDSVATSPGMATTSFTQAEIDTVYLQRYGLKDSTLLGDAATLVSAQPRPALTTLLKSVNLDTRTLVISNLAPFPPSSTGGKLNAYNYRLTVKDGNKGARAYIFYIENIQLTGNYEADGCCTYYRNTKKTFQVHRKALTTSTPFDATETALTETGGVPVPFILHKK